MKTVNSKGHVVSSDGYLQHQELTKALIEAKNNNQIPLTTAWINYLFRIGMTTNTEVGYMNYLKNK